MEQGSEWGVGEKHQHPHKPHLGAGKSGSTVIKSYFAHK